jgi:uncharacterized protein with HEPN domain
MKRDYRLYVQDILDAIESIESFIAGMSRETFLADDRTLSAVVRKFEIIGEAARQLPEGIREKHPHVPWRDMVGMRNRLIHDYLGADYELVWQTATEDLEQTKAALRKAIKEWRE